MSTLDALKLVAVKKPTHTPIVVIRRQKLASKVWEQLQLAKSQMDELSLKSKSIVATQIRKVAYENK